MDFLQDQPLDKLITTYIQLPNTSTLVTQRRQQETTLLNSILAACFTLKDGMRQVMVQCEYVLEVNSQDRSCLRRVGSMVGEIVARGEAVVRKAGTETVRHVIQFASRKALVTECCNEFISLLGRLASRLAGERGKEYAEMFLDFVTSPKIEILTYSQEARLKLYQLVLRGLQGWRGVSQPWKKQNLQVFLHKCVRAGEGERDPRNIESIFEIYLTIADMFEAHLTQYRSQMFQNIEAYYPIEFIKDEDNPSHQAIDLHGIARKLDQSLCHSFFAEETWQLITTKTAAPPIATFLPTLFKFLERTALKHRSDFLPRIKGMLLRFSQDEFMGEQFEDSSVDLGTIIARLLSFMTQSDSVEDGSMSWQGYSAVLEWVRVMVGKVTRGEYPHTGTLISVFRAVIDKNERAVGEVIRSHTLRTVINAIQPGNELIPKLGLAIVCLSGMTAPSESMNEIMGLLVLQAGSIYPQQPDEIRVLILKILLLVSQVSPNNLAMVRKVNNGCILCDYLTRAQQALKAPLSSQQMYLVKAFVDFVSVVYGNERERILDQVKGVNYQLQGYLLGRMWQGACKEPKQNMEGRKAVAEKWRVLIEGMTTSQQVEEVVSSLKAIPQRDVWEWVCAMSWKPSSNENASYLLSLILAIRKHLSTTVPPHELKPKSHLSGTVLETILRKASPDIDISPQQRLWRTFTSFSNTITYLTPGQIPTLDPLTFTAHASHLDAYPPTMLHWQWHHLIQMPSSQPRNDKLATLLPLIPQKLLLKDSQHITPLLLQQDSSTSALVSIATHLPLQALITTTGILPYCLKSIVHLRDEQTRVERSAGMLKIINNALDCDEKGLVRQMLTQHVNSIKKLQTHRKRLVRQAVRRLLDTLLNR